MKKFFYLSSCNTCKRIMSELELSDYEVQDVKEKHITEKELDFLKEHAASYESLFNKRAIKYRQQGLNEQTLSEPDWKKHILNEYTFLKRPILVNDATVLIGNAKKVVAQMHDVAGK